jgi:replication factor C small subunit
VTVQRNHTYITENGIPVHNCDKLSPTAQGFLRNEMETYADICRFVMTANYPGKIIPALHSRLQQLHFAALDKNEYGMRLADILDHENVAYTPELLVAYVEATYPDLRKCINLAQQNTHSGELTPIRRDESGNADYMLSVVELFRKGKFLEARKLVLAQIQPEEYEDFYRFMYHNLSLFGADQAAQDEAVLIIRKHLISHHAAADPEINLAAALIELSRLAKT